MASAVDAETTELLKAVESLEAMIIAKKRSNEHAHAPWTQYYVEEDPQDEYFEYDEGGPDGLHSSHWD